MNLIIVVQSFLCLFFIVTIDIKKKIFIACNYLILENVIMVARINKLAEKNNRNLIVPDNVLFEKIR